MTRRRPLLPFVVLYVALAVVFFLLMRDHAFHPTDDGFILSYSWRIAQGEVPYRDFLWERTPLSPYLHLGWILLPDGWQIQAGRLAYYLELAAAPLMLTVWAVGRGLRASVTVLAVAAGTFLLSLHNFPPMPWPTVDGIFLGSAGIAAFLRWHDTRATRWLAVAMTLLSLSVLAKQSFAPLLAMGIAFAMYTALRQRSLRVVMAAAAPPAIIGAVFLLGLVATGALAAFAQQIAQPAQMRPSADNPWTGDLFTIGVRRYLLTLSPAVVVFLAVTAGVFLLRERAARLAPPLVLGLVPAALALPLNLYGSGIVVFLFAATIALTEVVRAARGRPTSLPLRASALILTMAWCASLSFAYQTPLLAIGAIAPILAFAVASRPTRLESLMAPVAVAIVAIVVVFMNLQLPYRDSARDDQTADLGAIYPRFGHLYTNPFNADRHRELRDLSQRFAIDESRGFVVLTDFPLVHFLSGTRNPLSLDWLEPQEYLGNEERLRGELEASQAVVIVQRERDAIGAGSAGLRSCAEAVAEAPRFAAPALARSKLVMESTYFCVYAP